MVRCTLADWVSLCGGALGAALYINYNKLNGKRIVNPNDSMSGSLLGPKFTNKQMNCTIIFE